MPLFQTLSVNIYEKMSFIHNNNNKSPGTPLNDRIILVENKTQQRVSKNRQISQCYRNDCQWKNTQFHIVGNKSWLYGEDHRSMSELFELPETQLLHYTVPAIWQVAYSALITLREAQNFRSFILNRISIQTWMTCALSVSLMSFSVLPVLQVALFNGGGPRSRYVSLLKLYK